MATVKETVILYVRQEISPLSAKYEQPSKVAGSQKYISPDQPPVVFVKQFQYTYLLVIVLLKGVYESNGYRKAAANKYIFTRPRMLTTA